MVDRHSGNGAVGRPFWLSTGPATSDIALACSTRREALNPRGHRVLGRSNGAGRLYPARHPRRLALACRGKVTAIVRHEIGGLMTRRTAKAQHAEMEVLKAEAAKVD